MGIATILTAALKHVSWGQVAQIAMNYGPDLFRRLRAEAEPEPEADMEGDPLLEITTRIAGLEDVVIRQGDLIERQNASILELKENGRILQARLNLITGISALLALLILIMFVVLIRR